MATKTPPIPLKYQEKKYQGKKIEKNIKISLPPLTNGSTCHKQKYPSSSTSSWNKGTAQDDHLKKRLYKVLQIGATPLMHACQQGDRARVLRLLKEQQDTIGYRDRTLRNALHYCMDASTGGAVASAAPELVNAPDSEGHTPLHLAVIAGDTQLVAVLLANGADVNAKDLEGHSVLHWATVCGEAECVRLILAAGARPSTPDLRGGSPLHYAAQCCGAAVTAELSVPKKVGIKVLQTLLEFGADVNAKDEDGRQPILWAASAGSVEAVLALARTGGSAAAGATDKDGLTALHCAASRGHARCIETLVNFCGAQPDHVDDNGCSPLHYAATLGHADATALLLQLGADPNRQDRKGRTPALCAAAKGQLETLKILAQHGGSLHAKTVRGTGVAHEAVLSGRIELINWLARKKPNTLDVPTHDGKTPLHVAALHGYLDTCKVLIDHHSNINAIFHTSKSGPMTPLDAALYRGHRDCAKIIQMHGGATAHHLRTYKTIPNKAFAAKLKIQKKVSSSDSENEFRRERHQEPEVYFEEHWIERRTRKKTSPKRYEERRGSKSFSEEEIRISKSRHKNRDRRAKSESARFESSKREKKKSMNRNKRSKHEYGDSSSDSDDLISDDNIIGDDDDDDDDDISHNLSDDSLEILVVKKLEKKSEKLHYSERKSKTPRESKVTKRKSSKVKSKKSENSENDKKFSTFLSASEDDNFFRADAQEKVNKEAEKRKKNRFKLDVTDSTSQDTVEKVIVTALIHKDQVLDTPTSDKTIKTEEKKEEDTEEEEVEKNEHKDELDQILKEADQMQNELTKKATDFKKQIDDKLEEKVSPTKSNNEKEEEEESHSDKNSTLVESKDNKSITETIDDSESQEKSEIENKITSKRESSSERKLSDEEKLSQVEKQVDVNSIKESSHKSKSSDTSGSEKESQIEIKKENKIVVPSKNKIFESSEEQFPDTSAIVAVIESPQWDDEDEQVVKEIEDAVGNNLEPGSDLEDDSLGVVRVVPSTSEEETPRKPIHLLKPTKKESRIESKDSPRVYKQRKDSGGRDSGIEPSPRVSKIPKRNIKCYPNTHKQQILNIDTITRDVQISLRRYHLERKIFFQLMELKRLQIRHGKTNEQVLVKRQVDSYHKAGMAGPSLGVAKFDQSYTFRNFEAFLYEQLRRLQKRPATPDWCSEAKQCTQKTHRCHHATSAYTSIPIYTYLGDPEQQETNLLPRIESRGKGQMTVEVTKGGEKQIFALPAEKLDRTKRYYVTFTVRGEKQDEISSKKSSHQRNTKSV